MYDNDQEEDYLYGQGYHLYNEADEVYYCGNCDRQQEAFAGNEICH